MSTLRYRAVLFDLDGTLVDSYAALAEAVNFARREEGLADLATAHVRTLVGDGVETLLQRAFSMEEVPHRMRRSFENRYDEVCCQLSTILEEVETTLAALRCLDVAMAVCTNKPTPFSRKILDFLGLARHFNAVIGPDLADARKPDRRHVLRTLASTGREAGEALFVGDMPVDIAAARNSGVDVAVIATGSASAAQLCAAAPDYYLERFSDLIGVVKAGAAS